jgi:hypothetical protein
MVLADTALAEVQPADELAHDHEVERLAAGARALRLERTGLGQRREQLGGPEVREHFHVRAQSEQALLGAAIGRQVVPLGPAARAEQHGVGGARAVEHGGGDRLAVAIDAGAAERAFFDRERDAAELAGAAEDLEAFDRDFRTDPVTGQHEYVELAHDAGAYQEVAGRATAGFSWHGGEAPWCLRWVAHGGRAGLIAPG